ncbi:CRISPR-associated helicase Cas3' [Clostridium kluyveri]|uniref:CRISPR-associated helicase Cas3' n=1 Tax=Clostridium kluyveri TaxID=1534 RepID=UPI002245A07F|nr:CRISPR-associated helicase Cas3' [Clostridium kluyveri]UZQ51379.1 CRISPR-associated helicase Cas3' [Clostridium kluyveri]
MEFYSHNNPKKKIIEHLKEVKSLSEAFLPQNLKQINEIISFTHDFGKYTTYFQNYLMKNGESFDSRKNHAFISALLAAYICFEVFESKSKYPLIAYSCVLHHHGNLQNVDLNLPKQSSGVDKYKDEGFFIERLNNCSKQLKDLNNNKKWIMKDYDELGYGKHIEKFLSLNSFEDILLSLKKISLEIDMAGKSEDIYFLHQMLYSALIAGDKLSASDTHLSQVKFGSYEMLDRVRKEKCSDNTEDINIIRSNIFNEVMLNIEKNYFSNDIFSITAPTGTGKTYTGFFTALKLNELLGGNRRIIYSLPFTSIIDQNYDVIYELFEYIQDFQKEDSSYIIKHHNLSYVNYNSKEEDYTIDQAELLIENWNSGVVVTTFVQLLQTLIGTKNRMLKKFDSIRNSIILLDEIQALDIKYYNLIDTVLKWCCTYLNCKVIFMTATKPIILKDAVELLKNSRRYFDHFNRTKLVLKLNPVTVEEFLERFNDNIKDESYLIVCNTISQSLNIYNNLSFPDRKVYYLSTNLLPVHRRTIIKEVEKRLKGGEKIILVSTQVVEAGVDFDFDNVIRDIGPLDSIIQCAGRGNRNGQKSMCNVYVYFMVNENGNSFGSMVYGKGIINITKEILEGSDIIEENNYFDLIEKYFKKVRDNVNMDDVSQGFLKSMKKLYFKKEDYDYSLDNFSLIKDNPDYFDVFFRINDEAEETYRKFLNMIEEKDIKKRKIMYLEIKNKLRDYTLSLPTKKASNFEGKFMLNVPKESCDYYYDENTGYRREDNESFMVF